MERDSNSPAVPGIDLEFRPRSYFWPLGLEAHLLSRIKGAERRAALKMLIDAGQTDAIPDFLARSGLSESERQSVGRLHPSFMGGEYLPDMTQHEVAIARITIASTTQDVTSVYASRGKRRIYYRVVDEYGGDTLSGRNTRTSMKPLRLRELEAFFNGSWPLFDVLEMNFGYDGYPIDRILNFLVGIESSFYPQFGDLIATRVKEWASVQRAGA